MISKPIYDFLPTLYVIAGALLAAFSSSVGGKLSALLFVIAGVLVFNMRLNSREGKVLSSKPRAR